MNYVTVKEAAEILGTSHMTVRRKLKTLKEQLKDHVKVINGVTMLNNMGITVINKTLNKSMKTGNITHSHVNNSESHVNESGITEFLKDQLKTKDEIISKLLQDNSEKDLRHDSIIMKLSTQIQEQHKLIEDLKTKPVEESKTTPVKIIVPEIPKKNLIKPEPVSTPEEIKPSFKQKIIYFFNPHLQRKRA